MTYERTDFNVLRKMERDAKRLIHTKQRADAIGLLAQAAVPAESLMSDPHWALYQQMLQASLERMENHRARLVETLTSSACASAEQMFRVKLLIAEADGLISAWRTAIELPKQLRDSATKAQESLNAKIERYDEASRSAA